MIKRVKGLGSGQTAVPLTSAMGGFINLMEAERSTVSSSTTQMKDKDGMTLSVKPLSISFVPNLNV